MLEPNKPLRSLMPILPICIEFAIVLFNHLCGLILEFGLQPLCSQTLQNDKALTFSHSDLKWFPRLLNLGIPNRCNHWGIVRETGDLQVACTCIFVDTIGNALKQRIVRSVQDHIGAQHPATIRDLLGKLVRTPYTITYLNQFIVAER